MKVGFNARLLFDEKIRGWNRYTVNLLAELPALGVELLLYTSDRTVHESYLRRLPVGSYQVREAPRMPYALWEQAWLPLQLKRDGIELFHSPFNYGLPMKAPCPLVLTLHDAIDWVYYDSRASLRSKLGRRALEARLLHWSARRRADLVLTVSEYSKSDLVQHLGLDPSRIRVTYEAADARFSETVSEAETRRVLGTHQLDRAYVLYVGGMEGRKNLPFPLRAFGQAHLPGIQLVLGGGVGERDREALQQLARELGFGDRIRFLGQLDDADLPALYGNALCFAYPSEYEGFGLQLCEAMAAGCPTFAADATCFPEILGIGGEKFPLTDPVRLAKLLERAASDPAWRAELSRLARLRSRDFSWRKTAEDTLAAYRSVLRST